MSNSLDYEASRVVAGRLIHEYFSFIAEMANPGNGYVPGEMVAKCNERILRLMDEVVDAALGDKRLWVTIESTDDCTCCAMTWNWCDLKGTCCHECSHYTRVQVWPEEGST